MKTMRWRPLHSPALRFVFGAAGSWIATDFVLYQFGWAAAWLPLFVGAAATVRMTGEAVMARRKGRLAAERQEMLRAEERRLRPLDRPTGVDVVRLHTRSAPKPASPVRPTLGDQRGKPVGYAGAVKGRQSPVSPKPDLEKEFSNEPTRTSS